MTIQILSPQLANQIAAGEVVERPASVVKELIENSLDAGATQIEIEIEKGGSQMIRIRDNGCGINKEELALALSRHATSKVSSLTDLEQIMSLGFRGEALASISSVSRLTLTSKTAEQTQAWSALAEGREMDVKIQPAAHPTGSCVEAADLFFNTPARRRFLRTDKTEYSHIDEIVRRVALSRFDVQIKLSHNGALQRHYRIAHNEAGQHRRIAAICSKHFIENAIRIDADYDGIKMTGWLGLPVTGRNQADMQYCYINGRMMRDKLINHAIRQAYTDKIPSDLYPAYVLYIEIDPKQVDVNVHPAKHEVRFHQARLVHDFVFQTLQKSLAQSIDSIMYDQLNQAESEAVHSFSGLPEKQRQADTYHQPKGSADSIQPATMQSAQSGKGKTYSQPTTNEQTINQGHGFGNRNYSDGQGARSLLGELGDGAKKLFPGQQHKTPIQHEFSANMQPKQSNYQNNLAEQLRQYKSLLKPEVENTDNLKTAKTPAHWQLLKSISGQFILMSQADELYLVKMNELYAAAMTAKLALNFRQNKLISQPLLLPVAIRLEANQAENLTNKCGTLTRLGIQTQIKQQHSLIVQKVPAMLRELNIADVIGHWLTFYESVEESQAFPQQAAFLLSLAACNGQTLELDKIRPIFNEWKQFDPNAMQQWITKHSKMVDLSELIGNW